MREQSATFFVSQKASARRGSMWLVGVLEAEGAIVATTVFAEDQAVPEKGP
jgi:hypothetical protein